MLTHWMGSQQGLFSASPVQLSFLLEIPLSTTQTGRSENFFMADRKILAFIFSFYDPPQGREILTSMAYLGKNKEQGKRGQEKQREKEKARQTERHCFLKPKAPPHNPSHLENYKNGGSYQPGATDKIPKLHIVTLH
jgi:hypothetical protein